MNELERRLFDAVLGDEGIIVDMRYGNFRWEDKKEECLKAFKEVAETYTDMAEMPMDLVKTLIESIDQLGNFKSNSDNYSRFYFEVIQALGELAGRK